MKTLPAMPETDISIEGDLVTISQLAHYSSNTITFPYAMLNLIVESIISERLHDLDQREPCCGSCTHEDEEAPK